MYTCRMLVACGLLTAALTACTMMNPPATAQSVPQHRERVERSYDRLSTLSQRELEELWHSGTRTHRRLEREWADTYNIANRLIREAGALYFLSPTASSAKWQEAYRHVEAAMALFSQITKIERMLDHVEEEIRIRV